MKRNFSTLKELTDMQLIKEIFNCDKHINSILSFHFNKTQDIEYYPGAIMGLGDFYVDKSILLDELLKRRIKNAI